MILVTEAGYQGTVAFSACRTLPLSTSTNSSASPAAGTLASTVAAPATMTTASERTMDEQIDSIKNRDPVIFASESPRFHEARQGGHLSARRLQRQNRKRLCA